MAKVIARNGSVQVGINTVAAIDTITLNETMTPIRSDTLADAAETYESGDTGWTGEMTCKFDVADTNGQGALTIGAQVTVTFSPDGATDYSGDALVTNVSINNAKDQMVTVSYSLLGDGALTVS